MRVAARPAVSNHRSGVDRSVLYARALAVAVGLAFVVSVAGGSGPDAASGRLGGDFPAFYAAGSIIADGDWGDLYDPERQLAEQRHLFGDTEQSYLYFAYPPHVAALYRPLAALDYRAAYVAHSLLMLASVVAALALLRPVIRLLDEHFELAVIATALFYPMLRAVTGGQNTALTLLLLAGAWRALHDDNEVAAGLCLGLLLYKPQFALPMLGLVALRGHRRTLASGLVTATALWAAGAVVMGAGWLGTWWSDVQAFARLDAEVNGHNAISWLGFTEGVMGAGTVAARAVAAPLMAGTVAALVIVWRSRRWDLQVRFAVTILGVIMVSPHAMFYDAGLLALVGLVVLDRLGTRAVAPVGLVWVLAWSQVAAAAIGFAPLFVLMAGVALVMVPPMLDLDAISGRRL